MDDDDIVKLNLLSTIIATIAKTSNATSY